MPNCQQHSNLAKRHQGGLRHEQEPQPCREFHAATRAGKKKVTAPLTPEDHKRLRHLALDRDVTTEALLVEAINDLFVKYGMARTGQESRSR